MLGVDRAAVREVNSALRLSAEKFQSESLASLLDDPLRYAGFSRQIGDVALDFSRNRLDRDVVAKLIDLAEISQIGEWRRRLFAGEPVNNTESRPALHMALRAREESQFVINGENIMPLVVAERRRMLALADEVRAGEFHGCTGKPVTDVVNIGIGGSDLGLVMVAEALRQYASPGVSCHFVSNIDGVQLADLLDTLDPETTLFVICSKSFSTLETQLNANNARKWLCDSLPGNAQARHFIAVSVNEPAMDRFGIASAHRFRIWDWVGGRYSLWSSVGFAVAVAIGSRHFLAMLEGAAELDRHFLDAPLADNLPVIMGLLAVWNQNYMGVTSHAVLPYDQRLHRLPAFLQQLEMESNGKCVDREGRPIGTATGVVIWGEPGSNAQHSFLQLLHQGTSRISVDFIAPVTASSRFADQHRHGLSNMVAQAEALARGVSAAEVAASLRSSGADEDDVARLAPHKVHPGSNPSNILLFKRLDPASIGFLIALYEHRVFVQSVIWGINPFDQWGVELGKVMASGFYEQLTGTADNAVAGIAGQIRAWDTLE